MKKLFLLAFAVVFSACFFVSQQSYAQAVRGHSVYNKTRPTGTGKNPYYFTRTRKAMSFSKDDCEYEIKLCLDEYCYDEFDGYKNCRDKNIEEFNQVIDSCFTGMPSAVLRDTYRNQCKSYIVSGVNSYVKQMKQFLNYQTTMKECDNAKDMVRAAQACYGIAITKGANSWNKDLRNTLDLACGSSVAGGSDIMVEEFFSAGYMGTDGAGWLANFGMLNFTSKKNGWEKVIDAILARYIDIKKTECGEGEYDVSQVGQAASQLQSQGDALRVGVAAGIVANVAEKQQEKQVIEEASVIYLDLVGKISGYTHEDLKIALQNYKSNTNILGNPAVIIDYLKGSAAKIKEGTLIAVKTESGCYAYRVNDARASSLTKLGTDNINKYTASNPQLKAALNCK